MRTTYIAIFHYLCLRRPVLLDVGRIKFPTCPSVCACVRAWPAGAFYDRLAVDSTSGFRNLVRLAQRLRKLQLFLPRIASLFSENFTASDTTVDRIQITRVTEVQLMQYNVIFRPFSSSFCISSTGLNNRPIYEKVLQRASNIRTAARVGIGLHTAREHGHSMYRVPIRGDCRGIC